MNEAIGGLDPMRFALADANVVDHGVVPADSIGLVGDLPHARDARQATDDHVRRSGQGRAGVVCANVAAGVQSDFAPAVDKQAGGRQAEIIGRSSDQYASHRELLSTVTGSSTVNRRSYEGHTTLPVRIDPAAKTQGQWGRHECRDGGSARKGRVLRCRYVHVPCDRLPASA
jgi:hypothetical protein